MNTELVNLLLKAGIVKESELQRALSYESGSSLVERLLSLGYGSEIDVFKIIQNKLKLAVISADNFKNIPKNVIEFIPRDIVEKHHVLPFYMDSTTIHMAMFDPTQDPCLNEICFFTTLKVVPYGALASDLARALNKYYGLTLPETFRHGKENLDPRYRGSPVKPLGKDFAASEDKLPPLPNSRPTVIPKSQHSSTLPPLPGEKIVKDDSEVNALKDKLKQMQESFDKLSKVVSGQSKPDTETKKVQELKEKIKSIQEDTLVQTQDEALVADIDYEEDIPEFEDVSGVFNNPAAKQTELQTELDDIFVNAIEQGKDKDAVLAAVVKEIRKISSRSVILFVRYDDLLPISGVGSGIEDNIAGLRISLNESSVFRTVYASKKEFYGPVPSSDRAFDSFIKHFGGSRPRSIVIVPSMIDDEVFSVIYAEDTQAADELKKVSKAMAKAFEKLLNS